ncbi:hypothetical protein UFOVP466_1, partial [uncultured Caudovirales phage]
MPSTVYFLATGCSFGNIVVKNYDAVLL